MFSDKERLKYFQKENKELKKELEGIKKAWNINSIEKEDAFKRLPKIKQRISKIYFFGTITFLCSIGLIGMMFVIHASIVLIIVLGMLLFPVICFSIVINLVQLYRDRTKLRNFLIKKLAKKYLIVNFFTDDKEFEQVAFSISGNSFEFQKGSYLLDESCIWRDENKIPNLFYKKGIPNPLIFDFSKYIEVFSKADDKTQVFDDKNRILDLSYSSENLLLFKKDKIFQELHKETKGVGDFLIFIIMGIIFLVIILALIFKK